MVSSTKRLPSSSEGGKIVKFLSVSFAALCNMQSSSKRVAVFDLVKACGSCSLVNGI